MTTLADLIDAVVNERYAPPPARGPTPPQRPMIETPTGAVFRGMARPSLADLTAAQQAQRTAGPQGNAQDQMAGAYAPQPQGRYIGSDVAEATGLPSLVRGGLQINRALTRPLSDAPEDQPGGAIPDLAMGGLGLLGMFGGGEGALARPRELPRLPQSEPVTPLPVNPTRELARASDGSVLPVRAPEPFRQSMVGGSADLAEAAQRGGNDGGHALTRPGAAAMAPRDVIRQTFQAIATPEGRRIYSDNLVPEIKDAPADPDTGARGARQIAAPQSAHNVGQSSGFTVYHGSAHDFDRFDIGRRQTGEGGNVRGRGLYFADRPETANAYRFNDVSAGQTPIGIARDVLRDTNGNYDEAIAQIRDGSSGDLQQPMWREALQMLERREVPPGHLYQVHINADPASLFDLDAPFSQQPAAVRRLARNHFGNNATGKAVLEYLQRTLGRNWEERLREAGVPGLRYLEHAGDGGRNYVMFGDDLASITHKNGQPISQTPHSAGHYRTSEPPPVAGNANHDLTTQEGQVGEMMDQAQPIISGMMDRMRVDRNAPATGRAGARWGTAADTDPDVIIARALQSGELDRHDVPGAVRLIAQQAGDRAAMQYLQRFNEEDLFRNIKSGSLYHDHPQGTSWNPADANEMRRFILEWSKLPERDLLAVWADGDRRGISGLDAELEDSARRASILRERLSQPLEDGNSTFPSSSAFVPLGIGLGALATRPPRRRTDRPPARIPYRNTSPASAGLSISGEG